MDAALRAGTVDKLKAEMARHQPGFSLAAPFYTDPDLFELELERVVYRNWILAGHISEFPRAGDFKTVAVARESALIVRGEDNELRAFANVCRHRGSRVCLESGGSARSFACPYHGWTYNLEGQLTAAREMPQSFERSKYPLASLPLEVVHGLVFVAFGPAPPLAAARRDLARPMRWFGFESMKVAAARSYVIAANWKLAIENYQECYHCATAHPDYATRHTLMLGRKRRQRVQAPMLGRLGESGLEPLEIDRIDTRAPPGETGYAYSRTALFEGYLTGSRDGQPLAPPLGELDGFDGGASDFSFGGFSFLLAYSDHVVAYVFTPVAHDSSLLSTYWLVRDDAVEGRDYDVEALTWLWHKTTLEDLDIIQNNWRGVQSLHYRPGPLSTMESAQRAYIDWLLGELLEPDLRENDPA
ncbi:MAG: aromatic ring-hydroxylating dioxygenase subunit alpha [Pseudomonadota bacterium]